MDLEDAILAVLTAHCQTTWEVHVWRCGEMKLNPSTGGTAATLTCLNRLRQQGMVLLSTNDEGASVWRLPVS